MTYRFRLNGVDIECDSADEMQSLMKNPGFQEGARHGGARTTMDSDGRVRQAAGPKKSWEEADAYAKKFGVSRNEARIILAAQKKKIREKAAKEIGQVTSGLKKKGRKT